MNAAQGSSNVIDVSPGQSAELLRYCLSEPSDPKAMSVFLTCTLIDETPPLAPTTRDVKVRAEWQGGGHRGGGTALLDASSGSVFGVGATTLQLTAINQSENLPLNRYRVEASVVNHSVPHNRPHFSQRVVVPAGQGTTGLIRVPEYAHNLSVFTNPVTATGEIRFYQDNFLIPAVANALYINTYANNLPVSLPDNPIISGAEWVDIQNVGAILRRFALVWELAL